jgi:hypothetical protein
MESQEEKQTKGKEEKVSLFKKNCIAKRFQLLEKLVTSEKNNLIRELIAENADASGLVSTVEVLIKLR